MQDNNNGKPSSGEDGPLNLSQFEKKIKIYFKDKELLKLAFTHKSYTAKNKNIQNNQRLEYLGDAVLEMAISEYLYKKYPQSQEGELTEFRAMLVNVDVISMVAKELNLQKYLLFSESQRRALWKPSKYLLADTFEAFLGALHLDRGCHVALAFALKCISPHVDPILSRKNVWDPKGVLAQKTREYYKEIPTYHLIKEAGPDNNKFFEIEVRFGEIIGKRGQGKSKKQAEKQAAERTLTDKNWL